MPRRDVLAVTDEFALAYGVTEVFTIAAPGAGNNASRKTGSGYLERLRTLSFTLACSAAAANRRAVIEFRDADGNRYGQATAGAVVTASNTVIFGAGLGQTTDASTASGRASIGLPPVFLEPEQTLAIVIAAIDVGDTITAIRGLIDRYPIGPDGYMVGEVLNPLAELARSRRLISEEV